MATPETHYENLESLLKEVCLRTGSLPEEVDEFTLQQLQRTTRDSLKLIPSFIVIDDIDSNTPDEQKRIMEVARTISSGNSRILMTTRVNNIYSSDSSILVPGLNGEEYRDLIHSLCKTLGLQKYNDKKVEKLNTSSEGSPLFTESILRLCKLGLSVDNAIKEWAGKTGDAVREAALRKEVAELSPEAIKTLITISYIGSLSRSELHQYTDLENTEINDAIEQLGTLFLIQGFEFIEEEPRFESTASISKLVLSIASEIFPNADQYLERIREISEGLEANTQTHVPEVGAAIRQCNSLLKDGRYLDARNTIKSLIDQPRYKENGDLFFMLAKTEYEDPSTNSELVRKSFSEAFIKGQRKPAFFEMWYQIERNTGSNNSVFEVCENAVRSIGRFDFQWGHRYAYASLDMAMSSSDFNNKIRYLVNCYDNASKLIKISRRDKWQEYKDLNIKVVDLIWEESIRNSAYEISGRSVINAIHGGDIRSTNFNRLIEVSQFFIDGKNISDSAFKELETCLEWAPKLIREHGSNRESLALKLDQAYSNLKKSAQNKNDKLSV